MTKTFTMNTTLRKHFLFFPICLLFLLVFLPTSMRAEASEVGKVHLTVRMRHYDKTHRTARFDYYDIHTRQYEVLDLVFDTTGTTHISIDARYPLYNASTFSVRNEKNNFSEYLLVPGKHYNFEFDSKYIHITGESGAVNRTIYKRRREMSKEDEMLLRARYSAKLFAKPIPLEEYTRIVKKLENEQYRKFDEFCKTNELTPEAKRYLKARIKYNAGFQMLMYYLDFNSGLPKTNTPKSYIKEVLQKYPIDQPEMQSSGDFQQYVDLMLKFLWMYGNLELNEVHDIMEAKYDFADSLNLKVARLITGDRAVLQEEKFRTFMLENGENIQQTLLQECIDEEIKLHHDLGSNFAEDFIFYNSLQYYQTFDVKISPEQWKLIEARFHNKQFYHDLTHKEPWKEKIKEFNEKEAQKLDLYIPALHKRYFPDNGKANLLWLYSYLPGSTENTMDEIKKVEASFAEKGLNIVTVCGTNRKPAWKETIQNDSSATNHHIAIGDAMTVFKWKYDAEPSPDNLYLFDKDGQLICKDFLNQGVESVEDKLEEMLGKLSEPKEQN